MRFLRRTARAALVGISTLAFASACSDTTGVSNVYGTYQLTSINNVSLPFTTYEDATERDEIVGGYVELGTDGRFQDVVTYRVTGVDFSPQTDSDVVTGEYDVSGDQITFYPDDQSSQYTMNRSGRTLSQSFNIDGETFFFRYSR